MIAALRELVSHVGLQLVDHFDGDEHRRSQSADHPAVHRRCDADDGVLPARQPHRLSDDFRIAAIRALPIVVRENDDRMRAGGDVIFRPKQSTDLRAKPEQRKVVSVDQLAGERLDVVAHVARRERKHRDRHLRKRRRRGATKVDVVLIRERRVRKLILVLEDLSDLLRMWNGSAPKENGVYQAEYRRVRPDAERERQQRDEGEPGALACASDGEANVAGNCIHDRSP